MSTNEPQSVTAWDYAGQTSAFIYGSPSEATIYCGEVWWSWSEKFTRNHRRNQALERDPAFRI